MEGFSDLLFMLIMFLVISRSFGAARRKKEEQAGQGPVGQPETPRSEVQASREPGLRAREEMRSREQMRGPRDRVQRPREAAPSALDPAEASTGARSRVARRSDPVSEFRRRLIEAAREWEAEQRRRAGIPDEDAAPVRAERPRPPPVQPQPPVSSPSRWQETHDVTPDRAAAVLAGRSHERPATTTPVRRPPSEPATVGAVGADPSSAGRRARGPVAAESEADEARELAPHERKTSSPLARLERFPPLKRAVILAEILGRPTDR